MKRLLVWLALLALCLAPCARAENAEPEFTIPPPGVSMLEKKAELEEQERLNATEPPPAYSQEQIDALPDEVFAQCDSYMAVLQDSTYPISFYLYYKGDAAFGGREVAGVAFPDAPGIEFYEVKTLEGERGKGDRFGALMAAGLTTHLALQVFLNIGVVTNFLPATGISLPFFSYGGTALLIQLFEMGLILAVSRQNDNKLL